MFRIGMLTSGGDCQALNAAMRGVVKGLCSKRNDVEIYGFQDGYKGLIYSNFEMLTAKDFSGILTMGGTILGTSRQPFKLMRVPDENGLDKVEAMKQTYYKTLPGLPCDPWRKWYTEDSKPSERRRTEHYPSSKDY